MEDYMASFKDAIQQTKVTKTSAKKSTVPILSDVPAPVSKAATEFLTKTKAVKDLQAELADLTTTITNYVSPIQDERAFKGDFNKSYKIPAGDQELMISTKNVFKINSEDEPAIKKIFGPAYSTLFTEKMEVVLKEEVLVNDTMQEELMALLGDNFAKFFDTHSTLKVVEDYDEKIFTFAKTAKKLADIRVLVQPTKPALK
jgi:hypothetical protein